jgi:hypothetical protein
MKKYLLVFAGALCFVHAVSAMEEDLSTMHEQVVQYAERQKSNGSLYLTQSDVMRIKQLPLSDGEKQEVSDLLHQKNKPLFEKTLQLMTRKKNGFTSEDERKQFDFELLCLHSDKHVIEEYKKAYFEALEHPDNAPSDVNELRKAVSFKSFFSDPWAVAGVIYITAYCAAMIYLMYHYKIFPMLKNR